MLFKLSNEGCFIVIRNVNLQYLGTVILNFCVGVEAAKGNQQQGREAEGHVSTLGRPLDPRAPKKLTFRPRQSRLL